MKKSVLVISAILFAVLAIWLSLDLFLTDRYAVSFQPRYVTPTFFDPDAALLLKVDTNANTILLTARGRSEVFKFDATTREVARTEPSDWNSSPATEIDCGKQLDLDEYSGAYYGHYL